MAAPSPARAVGWLVNRGLRGREACQLWCSLWLVSRSLNEHLLVGVRRELGDAEEWVLPAAGSLECLQIWFR